METSITSDLGLDSIEIMDLLIEIQDIVNKDHPKNEDTNVDKLLAYLFGESDDLTVRSLCKFIDGI